LALNYIENAMNDIKQQKIKKITIYTDSKLIVGHINEGWKINANIALVTRAKKILNELKEKGINIAIEWVPRHKNLAGIKIENGEIE
jgi:ribonuclease HI